MVSLDFELVNDDPSQTSNNTSADDGAFCLFMNKTRKDEGRPTPQGEHHSCRRVWWDQRHPDAIDCSLVSQRRKSGRSDHSSAESQHQGEAGESREEQRTTKAVQRRSFFRWTFGVPSSGIGNVSAACFFPVLSSCIQSSRYWALLGWAQRGSLDSQRHRRNPFRKAEAGWEWAVTLELGKGHKERAPSLRQGARGWAKGTSEDPSRMAGRLIEVSVGVR